MKRRKAIGAILLAGSATAATVGGYEWYTLVKNPDRNYVLGKKALLEELAETIIPATQTPGAREAGAVEYMMRILTDCTDTKTLNRFVEGLKSLENYTYSTCKKEFNHCTPEEKEQVLLYFEQKSSRTNSFFEKIKNKFTGRPFFQTLKSYTVYGYCISEKGATQGLNYIAVPGKYLSCIPLESNQKAWATK